jgi:hypothetical protein
VGAAWGGVEVGPAWPAEAEGGAWGGGAEGGAWGVGVAASEPTLQGGWRFTCQGGGFPRSSNEAK